MRSLGSTIGSILICRSYTVLYKWQLKSSSVGADNNNNNNNKTSGQSNFARKPYNYRTWTFQCLCVTLPNFVVIGQTVAEIWRFLDFIFKMAAVRHHGFVVCVCLDHSQRSFGSIYLCTKFGWNRRSNFDNMKALILTAFGLKCLFTPQNEFLEDLTP